MCSEYDAYYQVIVSVLVDYVAALFRLYHFPTYLFEYQGTLT